jgi:hypothetical protein
MRPGLGVLHYLKATYRWLSTNSPSVGPATEPLRNEQLFLNVDDPTARTWQWASAEEMASENHDVENIQRVRKFLLTFRPLLEVSGVIDVKYPDMDLAMARRTMTSFT